MKVICISVDCSCHMKDIGHIKRILNYDVMDLLKFNFKVYGIHQNDVFLKIYIDAEGVDGVYTDYLSISNYCFNLVSRMLFNHGYDLIVAVYTDTLPDELKPSDTEVLAALKKKLSGEETITIPMNLAKDICHYCESQAVYDKLSSYGDFYYRLKKKIEQQDLLSKII